MMAGGMREALMDMGEINEAGKELPSFLSINEDTVCSTWF